MTFVTDRDPNKEDSLKKAIRIWNMSKEERSNDEEEFLLRFKRLNPNFVEAMRGSHEE